MKVLKIESSSEKLGPLFPPLLAGTLKVNRGRGFVSAFHLDGPLRLSDPVQCPDWVSAASVPTTVQQCRHGNCCRTQTPQYKERESAGTAEARTTGHPQMKIMKILQ